MPVQDAVRTVTLPRQAAPVDAPLPPLPTVATDPAPAAASTGWTAEERQFAVALTALFVFLSAVIVGGLVLAQYVWD